MRVRLLVLPGLVLGLACGASDEDQEIPPGEGGGVVFPGFAQAAGGASALGMGGSASGAAGAGGAAGKAGGGGIVGASGAGGASGASGAGASGKAGGSGAAGASGKGGAAGASGKGGASGASGSAGGSGGAAGTGVGGTSAGGAGGAAGGAGGAGGAGASGGAAGAKSCPAGTKTVGGGCYFLVTTPLARDAADAACDAQIKGARLASFASKAAQDAVTATSGLKPQGTDYWMGLGCATHDAACNTISLSVWRWPDGAMPAYADWNETPNDGSGCARLYRAQATGAFAWRDRPCDSQYGAVCQVP